MNKWNQRRIINQINAVLDDIVVPREVNWTKAVLYLHTDKGEMYNQGKELGLKGEALGQFCYTGYEVAVDIEINKRTGEAYATHLNGAKLKEEIAI